MTLVYVIDNWLAKLANFRKPLARADSDVLIRDQFTYLRMGLSIFGSLELFWMPQGDEGYLTNE